MKLWPFSDSDTFTAFRSLLERTTGEIDALQNEYVAKASVTELEQFYIDKATIEPLTLHEDQRHVEDQSATSLDVSHEFDRAVFPGERAIVQGTAVRIAIPYEGDENLWHIRPSTFTLAGFPEIDVSENAIAFTYAFADDRADSQRLKDQIDSTVKSLAGAIANQRRDVENHNRDAPVKIKAAIERKRTKALAAISAVASLGIPIKRRDALPTFTIPIKRRPSPMRQPTVATEPYRPEPALAMEEYDYILGVARGMSMVIERNPHSFASLQEEDIRNHFLIQLNGHYEGSASGETFNASGKTDILVREDDRNVFIAECKFWDGPKAFNEAIDQLLSYLSWRDSKCALIVFNRRRDSSAVRQKMHEVMESRPEHRRTVSHDQNGDSRYVFVKESDPGREIIITTQLYDVPTPE